MVEIRNDQKQAKQNLKLWERYQEYLKNRKPTIRITKKGILIKQLLGEK